MIGEKQIIKARKDKLRPSAVFIEIGLSRLPVVFQFDDPERALDNNLFPTILMDESECGRRVDWRFLAGCSVHVLAPSLTDSILAMFGRIVDAGVLDAVACGLDSGEMVVVSNGEWSGYAGT